MLMWLRLNDPRGGGKSCLSGDKAVCLSVCLSVRFSARWPRHSYSLNAGAGWAVVRALGHRMLHNSYCLGR